jgi:hypothetical protein
MKVARQIQRIRVFLFVEGLAFSLAAFVHVGLPVEGYEHREAVILESVLASILFLGFLLTWINPSWARRTGIAVQGMALLGTVISRFSIIAGDGSWTILDLVFYRAIMAGLIWGLVVAIIAPTFNALTSMRQEVEAGKARD